MKLQYGTVAKTLAKLNIRFRTYSPESLKLVVREYHEDLVSEMSDEDFIESVKLARKQSRFFPSVAEIIEYRKEVVKSQNPYLDALPYHRPAKFEEFTKDDWEESNKERLRLLGRSAAINMKEVIK